MFIEAGRSVCRTRRGAMLVTRSSNVDENNRTWPPLACGSRAGHVSITLHTLRGAAGRWKAVCFTARQTRRTSA